MFDQAEDLRKLTNDRRRGARPKLLAVVGGMRGVGTTTVGLQLTASFLRSGRRAVFVAAETGMHNGSDCYVDAELTVFDVGNRLDATARKICRAADAVLFVATPDAESIVDAFSTLESLADCVSDAYLLVNKSPDEATAEDIFRRLAWTARRMLGIELRSAGCMTHAVRTGIREKIGQLFLNVKDLSVDHIGQLLLSDRLLKWKRSVKFNSRQGAVVDTLELDS